MLGAKLEAILEQVEPVEWMKSVILKYMYNWDSRKFQIQLFLEELTYLQFICTGLPEVYQSLSDNMVLLAPTTTIY